MDCLGGTYKKWAMQDSKDSEIPGKNQCRGKSGAESGAVQPEPQCVVDLWPSLDDDTRRAIVRLAAEAVAAKIRRLCK
jgi:hypothetical protein